MTDRDEATGLTPKQEAFALAYFETGNAAEAYRRAYDVSENAKDGWIYVEACQLLDHPKVALRLQALQEQAEKLAIYTRQAAMEEYERARHVAEAVENPSAMVSAINGKVKLWGLEVKQRTTVEHVGRNGGPIQTQDVTEGELIERAKRLGLDPRALGLAGGEEETD